MEVITEDMLIINRWNYTVVVKAMTDRLLICFMGYMVGGISTHYVRNDELPLFIKALKAIRKEKENEIQRKRTKD